MGATLKDVANLAGVNFTLVSKYLNHSPQARMTPETRERIEAAIHQLNYRPSATARTLRSGRSRTIGMICRDLTNSYTAHFANLVLKDLANSGYQLLLAVSQDNGDPKPVESLLSRQIDGLLLPGSIARLPAELPCPSVSFDDLHPHGHVVNLDLQPSLEKALSSVDGPIAGLFFAGSRWGGEFQQAARRKNLDGVCHFLSIDQELRKKEIRSVCLQKPAWIFSNGWHTIQMLQELLDDEFPDYAPRLLLHANCTGPFLGDRRIAGVIRSSTRSLVRELVTTLLEAIDDPEKPPRQRLLSTSFVKADSDEYTALVNRHFALT